MSENKMDLKEKTLIEKLRTFPFFINPGGGRWYQAGGGRVEPIAIEAADEIERLKGLIEKTYKVLAYYANTTTYQAPRTSGVTGVCTWAPDPTPDELAQPAREAMLMLERAYGHIG